ncbi:unnamed protein product, partial [Laminaria digitata]
RKDTRVLETTERYAGPARGRSGLHREARHQQAVPGTGNKGHVPQANGPQQISAGIARHSPHRQESKNTDDVLHRTGYRRHVFALRPHRTRSHFPRTVPKW